MSRWESNGDNYHRLEDDLTGARVRLGYGSQGQFIEGTLKVVPAATRGNKTLAVRGRVHNSQGVSRKREVPLWTLRKRPFTLEPVARHRLTPARPEVQS